MKIPSFLGFIFRGWLARITSLRGKRPMHEAVRAHFQALQDAVETTALTADRKQMNACRIGQLADLYASFRESYESRFLDEITGVIRLMLRELEGCPKAQALDAPFRDKLMLLHEELGLPALNLKSPAPPRAGKKTNKTTRPVRKAS
jgi:hypothetical protein